MQGINGVNEEEREREREIWLLYLTCCGCLCFVSGTVDWSAICGCSISWSYSHFGRNFFCIIDQNCEVGPTSIDLVITYAVNS